MSVRVMIAITMRGVGKAYSWPMAFTSGMYARIHAGRCATMALKNLALLICRDQRLIPEKDAIPYAQIRDICHTPFGVTGIWIII